jgi:hypothetical protein
MTNQLTKVQQQAIIAYVVAHRTDCSCKQCEYFGGIRELFNLYKPDDFTDPLLRKIYSWLKIKWTQKTCYLQDLDFTDPTAPLVSDISNCADESMVFKTEDDKVTYLTLKEILND